MKITHFRIFSFLALTLLAYSHQLWSAESQHQFLRNGGFEEDECSFRGEPPSSCGGANNDQWVNMRDLFPDGWTWPGKCYPSGYGNGKQSKWPLEEVKLDTHNPHSGKQSLRLTGKKVNVQQVLSWNELKDLYMEDVDKGRNYKSRAKDHSKAFAIDAKLFDSFKLSGWVRSQGLDDKSQAFVSLKVKGYRPVLYKIPHDAAQWKPFEIEFTVDKIKAGQSGKGLRVAISLGPNNEKGIVWVDDLKLTRKARFEPNLFPGGSFEAAMDGSLAKKATGRGTEKRGAATVAAGTAYPQGWSQPSKWTYLPRPTYYVWNHWQHFFTHGRGYPKLDSVVAHKGKSSFRFDLLPGDEYSVDSPLVILNQTERRPVEVCLWVKADRVQQMDICLIDEKGKRILTNQTLVYWGGLMAGTHDWIALRKVFMGYEPLKSVKLRIAARGFNGVTRSDIIQWHAYNQVSTLWIDDIEMRELQTSEAELSKRKVALVPDSVKESELKISRMDLGERLYGKNAMRFQLENRTGGEVRGKCVLIHQACTTLENAGESTQAFSLEAGGSTQIALSYQIEKLSKSWRDKPGTLTLKIIQGKKLVASETYCYNTWSVISNVQPSKTYLDETENPVLMALNLGLAKQTLSEVKKLRVEVVHRNSGKVWVKKEISDIAGAIASSRIEDASKDRFYFYVPRAGLLDHRNLILKELDISKLPARPWDNPEAEWVIRVHADLPTGSLMIAESQAFGKLTKFDEVLEPIKEVTIDKQGNFFRVNGKPFLPLAQSHSNGAALGRSPKSRAVSFYSDRIKVNNLNGVSRWCGLDVIDRNWKVAQVYGPMLNSNYHHKPVSFLKEHTKRAIESGNILVQKGASFRYKPLSLSIKEVNEHPAVLAYFVRMNEALLESDGTSEAHKQAECDYADALRGKLKRPIGVMENHSQFLPWHDDDGYLDHFDAYYFEREGGNLYRPHLALRNLLKRKKGWVMVDLPQTYENVPHARERYFTLLNTMHGHRGWFGIQGTADPSLYRGLGGELRYIFKYLSANEGHAEVNVPYGTEAKSWKKGKNVLVMVEQHNPVPHGDWEWKRGVGGRAEVAHSGASSHLVTPVYKGYAIHGYNDDLFHEIGAGDVLEQEVYLEPKARPKAVFLVLPGNASFNHVAYWGDFDHAKFRADGVDAFLAGECYSLVGYGINGNWVRKPKAEWLEYQKKMRFPASAFHRMGDLPKAGAWHKLQVPLAKLGLVTRVVDGIMFMSSGSGKAWYGKSILRRKSGEKITMVDGRIGRDQDQYLDALISLSGYKNGRVRVVGENRSLSMRDGQWRDDLKGEDLHDTLRDGWLGDGITYRKPADAMPETLELGYTYDNSPRCIRVYEVIPE